MRAEISAMLDGELEQHEIQPLLVAMRRHDNPYEAWREYQLIGETLRGEPRHSGDLAQRVMAELQLEPTVLAPRARNSAWHRPLLALAASAAGVAVVGWLALAPQQGQDHLAATASLARQDAPGMVAAVKPAAGRDMQEYLVAHQAQSSAMQLYGGAQHVRTVAAAGYASAK